MDGIFAGEVLRMDILDGGIMRRAGVNHRSEVLGIGNSC